MDIGGSFGLRLQTEIVAQTAAIAARQTGIPIRLMWTREQAMRAAAARLIGEHDFTSFRAAECQARSPVKVLRAIEIGFRGEPLCGYWRFDFDASAFLHHMVRNILGCLVAVGAGQHPPGWLAEVLAARRREVAAPTFPADGLYFLGPYYDGRHGIPATTAAHHWLP